MRIALFSAALLSSTLATAATPIDGWYGSVFGGYSNLTNLVNRSTLDRIVDRPIFNTFNSFTNFSPLNNFNFDNLGFSTPRNGYNAGVRLGFQSNALRYEGEFSYIGAVNRHSSDNHRNRFNQFNPFFNPFNSNLGNNERRNKETNAVFGMANVYFDFPVFVPCISPFIGVGIGYGWVESKLDFENPFFNGLLNPLPAYNNRINLRLSDSAFSYQATAGFTFNYLENWALNIAYRYIGTTKLKDFDKTFQGNLLSVGVIYRFNEYNYK